MIATWTTLLAAADSASVNSSEFFGLDGQQRFVVLLVAMGCLTGVIITVGAYIYAAASSMHRRRTEADLKREMLDRGMSADEIAKVIETAAPPEDATGRWIASWCKKR